MYNWSWEVENKEFLEKTIKRCGENQIVLPKFIFQGDAKCQLKAHAKL